MTQQDQAQKFAALHAIGAPLVLTNIWDAGSARAVAEAGARAIATGSWSVAAAQGYEDGQALPLAALLACARQVVRAVDLPVSVDFEGGYAEEPDDLAENIRALIGTGVVGLNFEDQVIGGSGLHDTDLQARRVAALRAAAEAEGVALFINARTDLFLQNPAEAHEGHIDAALARARAYAEAGASGFFVPGLQDRDQLTRLCTEVALPVNVMRAPTSPSIADLAACGVARISHGPFPYRDAMARLTEKAAAAK